MQKSGAADREQFFRTQVDGVEPWPIAFSMTDREIDILTRKIDMMHGCREVQFDLRVRLRKTAQPVHEPFSSKVRRRTDHYCSRPLTLDQSLCSKNDPVKSVSHD